MESEGATVTRFEYVYGPNWDDWHLTCNVGGEPIYPGQGAHVTETDGEYDGAVCAEHRDVADLKTGD